MNKADRAFLRYLTPSPTDRAVDLWYRNALVARAVAARIPDGRLTLLIPDATAKATAEHDLLGIPNVVATVAADAGDLPATSFDLAYLAIRPYLSNARLANLLLGARRCLCPGRPLVLYAPMRQGAPTVLQRAEDIFGNIETLDKPGGARIARCYATEATPAPSATLTMQETLFTVHLRGLDFSFVSAPDVFSFGELDEGTRLLLESVEIAPAERIIDLGCGYGAIGVVAARLAPQGWTTMVDTSAHAVTLARRNIERNDVPNADAIVSDGLAAVVDRRFTLVLSNPPLHAASGTIERLTRQAHAQLVPHGRLAYVVHKGYDARPILHAVFGNSTTLAETEVFRLIGATR